MFKTLACSISSYDDLKNLFIIPQLPSPSNNPAIFTLVLISFLFFILASAVNLLIMFYQLSCAGDKTARILDTEHVASSAEEEDDDLEMSKIAEKNSNKTMKSNSKQIAKPPEVSFSSQSDSLYSSHRIIKAATTSCANKSSLTTHQKARQLAYGVPDDAAPFEYTDKCYNAIFYENRINQLLNRDPFLFRPRVGSIEICSGIFLTRMAGYASANNYINHQSYTYSFFN